MKRETIQRRVGTDGKYGSLFKRIKRTWASKEYGAKNAIREFLSASRPTIAETIDQREKLALAIIEAEGYEIQRPYRFSAELIGKIETQIRDEILLENPHLEKRRAKDEGSLTPLGRAAQILKDCHDLRQSLEAGNVEKTASNAMLLQNSVDELLFSEYELAAFVGTPIVGNRNAEKHTDEDK